MVTKRKRSGGTSTSSMWEASSGGLPGDAGPGAGSQPFAPPSVPAPSPAESATRAAGATSAEDEEAAASPVAHSAAPVAAPAADSPAGGEAAPQAAGPSAVAAPADRAPQPDRASEAPSGRAQEPFRAQAPDRTQADAGDQAEEFLYGAAARSTVQTAARRAPVSGTPYLSEDEARPRRREGGVNWALVVPAALLVAAVLVVGLFSWDRWLRYDDAADIQGTWVVSGSSAAIVIDGDSIWISDEVAYSYTIDAKAKTIEFTFGDLSGSARYQFSSDRSELILVDGQGFTWTSTLVQDIGLLFGQVASLFTGEDAETLADAENATVLEAS